MPIRVALCTPTRDRPHPAFLQALEGSVPLLDAAGIEHSAVFEVGCPYISGARATMLGKALKWGADQIIFLDDDVSWEPSALLRLIEADGDVVGCTYRYKIDEEKYMGKPFVGPRGHPLVRADGAVHMLGMPAGFLRVTRAAVERFMEAYPDLMITADGNRNVDLFNHGAMGGVWYGEDYAFCRRWIQIDGDVWCLPNLDIDHNGRDKVYRGNYHRYLSTYKPVKEAA